MPGDPSPKDSENILERSFVVGKAIPVRFTAGVSTEIIPYHNWALAVSIAVGHRVADSGTSGKLDTPRKGTPDGGIPLVCDKSTLSFPFSGR